MTFAQLKAALLAQIGRAPSDICYQLVTADINNGLRVKEMEATASLVEAASVALPADFLAVIEIYRDVADRTPLQPTTPQAIARSYQPSGTPTHYAVVDGNLLLNPSPDGSSNIALRYYAALDDLVADGDTNAVLARFPSLYVYGVLSHHASLIRDTQSAAIWEAQYQKAARAAMATNGDRYAGAPLVPTVRVAP